MIKLLKTNTPLVSAFAFLFVLGSGLGIFFADYSPRFSFFVWYNNALQTIGEFKLLNYGLTVIFLLAIGYTISRAFNKTSFYQKTTGFPIFIFLVIASTFNSFYFDTSHIVNLLLSFVFLKIIELDQNKSAIHIGFISGILVGISSIFSVWVVPIGILIFFSLNTFRPFQWREWLVSVLGMGLPLIYLSSWRYIFYEKFDISPQIEKMIPKTLYWYDYLAYTLLFMIVFLALIKLRKHLTYASNIERKQINILVFFTILTLAISGSIFVFFNIDYPVFLVPLTLLISIPIMNSNRHTIMNFSMVSLLVLNLFRIFFF